MEEWVYLIFVMIVLHHTYQWFHRISKTNSKIIYINAFESIFICKIFLLEQRNWIAVSREFLNEYFADLEVDAYCASVDYSTDLGEPISSIHSL